MSVHHIISEADQEKSCPYCGKSTGLRQWKSVFSPTNSHYKECVCTCGHRVSIKMPFIGSGHDSWGKSMKDLDKRIAEEDSKSRKE